MSKRLYHILITLGGILGCTGSGGQLQAQGIGGGVYLEDGAQLIGCVIAGNKAVDGFGASGGNATVVNCTFGENEKIGNLKTGIRPGHIYCANGDIVDTLAYESRAEQDAVGVVFWVNSDSYAVRPRGYVLALHQAKKAWGDLSVNSGENLAQYDTACYANTEKLIGVGSEAALYCQGYADGQAGVRNWKMPAGYQLSCIFSEFPGITKTLAFLKKKDSSVEMLMNDSYWSSTESSVGVNIWALDFNVADEDTCGGYLMLGGLEQHWVRPVVAY